VGNPRGKQVRPGYVPTQYVPTSPTLNGHLEGINTRLQGVELEAVQTFDVSLASQQNVIWSGAGGGFGNLVLAAVIPAADTQPLTEAAVYCVQAPGGGGGVAVGVYDFAGARIANTAITPPGLGLNVLPFTVGSGMTLSGGQGFYLAVYLNQNGARLLGALGITGTPGGANPLGFQVPNSGSIDASGFPANVAAFFGSQTTQR